MSCVPASHSMTTVISQVDSKLEESPDQRRGSRAYQIFPEPNINDDSTYPEGFMYRRERLPSIVVEPTDCCDTERRELCLHPRCVMGNSVEEEEQEVNSSSPIEASVDGEQQEHMGMDGGSLGRKSSIGPYQSQLPLTRLTPPASPTPPEAAPPCLRS